MRSFKTKKIVAGAMLAAHLFTVTPIYANDNVNSNENKNQKVIIEKTDVEFLQECLDKKDYISFQKKYDELIERKLIDAEPIVKYAPVLGPKTKKAISILQKNGYLLDEEKTFQIKEVKEVKKEEKEKKTSIEEFKDEMKRTPYNLWDEQKQLEKSLTILEKRTDYLKLLYSGDTEYPYSYYIGERWLIEFTKTLNQLEAQYSKTLRYENSKDKMDEIIKKNFPEYESYEKLMGSMIILRNNVQYVLNDLKLMKNKLKNAQPVQINQIIIETKKEISNRLNEVTNRILILDSNKMPYLYSYSIESNLKPNYLDVLEHISSNEDFIKHKKWLTENYFKTTTFGNYNKDEVILAYNELSLGTQHALFKYYFNEHNKNNIPNSEKFALQVFGLNVQGYESAASIVQYLNRMDKFDAKTQLEIYRRIGAGTTFAETESDWINLTTYINTDVNEALGKVLKTDIVMIRDQTKDRYELKSASIGTPGFNVREDINTKGSGSVHLQEAFTMIEQGYYNNDSNVQGSNINVNTAPHLNGTNLENARPKGHSRNIDDMFGRNRVETTVPKTNVQIVKSIADLGVFNYRYVQKGTFTNLISRTEENLDYTKTTNLGQNETEETSKVDVTYTNNLTSYLNADGPSRYSNNQFNWGRSKSTSYLTYENENERRTNDFESVSDSFSLNSKNRNLFSTNNFGISLFDLESNLKVGESPNTSSTQKTEIITPGLEDESYTINKTKDMKGDYEYYLDSKMFSGWYENYSRGNFGEIGLFNEVKTFRDSETNENTIIRNGTDLDKFKEWDFENIYNLKEWQLHAGTQQLNVYTNSLFFSGMYKGVFTIRPENSYYLKFGEIENQQGDKSKIHNYYKDEQEIPSHIKSERDVFNSDVVYHGAGGVLGIPFNGNNEIGLGYVHNKTLMDKDKHLGLLSYSWHENSIAALSLYQGSYNISRGSNPYSLFTNQVNQLTRNDLFNYKFPRDSKSMEQLYLNSQEATFIEATVLNKDNLNITAFAGSGEEYNRIQAGAISNYVHDLFKLKVGGIYDEGNNLERENGAGNLYLSNKKETAYILGSILAQKELGWKTDEALRYLGELFGLKVETKAYTSFSENNKLNEKGRFIGAEISFKDDTVVLYYFGGKDVYSENIEEHKEFNLIGASGKFTPNLSIEAYGTWKGDLGNGAFLHPIITHNNNFGITALIGYTQDKVNFNLLNERVKKDYLTTGLGVGFRKGGLSLLLLPISYTNNFEYKHIIETGLSGTYWLPGGSLGFGTGYVHNIIQNPTKSMLENPFKLPYKDNNFNSRMFYLYGEGSGRGIMGFDYTKFRLTGKLGENELYKLYQTIATLEMSDFWKRIYFDLSFTYKMDKGDLILQDNSSELKNVMEKYNVKGILGVEFYF